MKRQKPLMWDAASLNAAAKPAYGRSTLQVDCMASGIGGSTCRRVSSQLLSSRRTKQAKRMRLTHRMASSVVGWVGAPAAGSG